MHVAGFAALMALMLLVAFHRHRYASSAETEYLDRGSPATQSKPIFLQNKTGKSDAKSVWIGGDIRSSCNR